MKNTLVTLCLSAVLCGACCTETQQQASPFVQVEKGMFVRDGKPYKYIGANFWYGGILASEGEGGNRERLVQELDSLKSIGIDNLRILVGSDGARGIIPDFTSRFLKFNPSCAYTSPQTKHIKIRSKFFFIISVLGLTLQSYKNQMG